MGSSTNKEEEEEEEDLNARDENFDAREALDSAGDNKLNIVPAEENEEEDEQKRDTEGAGKTVRSGSTEEIQEKGNKITYEEVTEEIINSDAAPDYKKEKKVEHKPKVLLEEMEKSTIEPTILEPHLSNDFAENNYWRETSDIDINSLEGDYEI